jgi:surfeit locus 1 family protein
MPTPVTLDDPPRRAPWSSALPTLAALAMIVVCVAAGNWQRGRMEDKAALRQQLDTAASAPPAALPAGTPDWNAWRYRTVELEGTYDASRQILLDNKVHAGRAGYHVVTPLDLADGRAVLVDRGFVAAGATRTELPAAAPPPGAVTVRGRVNLPGAYVELKDAPASGRVWQNLDPARFAAATGKAVVPVVVEQDPRGAPADGLARDWPAPDTGIDKHRIYMVQWYSFAALAAGLWLWFTLRRARRTGDD